MWPSGVAVDAATVSFLAQHRGEIDRGRAAGGKIGREPREQREQRGAVLVVEVSRRNHLEQDRTVKQRLDARCNIPDSDAGRRPRSASASVSAGCRQLGARCQPPRCLTSRAHDPAGDPAVEVAQENDRRALATGPIAQAAMSLVPESSAIHVRQSPPPRRGGSVARRGGRVRRCPAASSSGPRTTPAPRVLGQRSRPFASRTRPHRLTPSSPTRHDGRGAGIPQPWFMEQS